jgi:hypothetical protein
LIVWQLHGFSFDNSNLTNTCLQRLIFGLYDYSLACMAAAFTLGAPVRAAATADSETAADAAGDTGQQVILQCNTIIVQRFTHHNERALLCAAGAVAWLQRMVALKVQD